MRIGALVFATAAMMAVSIDSAPARDGCGGGWYFDGYGCAPMYGRQPNPRPSYYHYGRRYFDPGSPWAPNFGGNVVRPTVGMNGQISCSNPNYTWQNGACRPYRGW